MNHCCRPIDFRHRTGEARPEHTPLPVHLPHGALPQEAARSPDLFVTHNDPEAAPPKTMILCPHALTNRICLCRVSPFFVAGDPELNSQTEAVSRLQDEIAATNQFPQSDVGPFGNSSLLSQLERLPPSGHGGREPSSGRESSYDAETPIPFLLSAHAPLLECAMLM